ncbi:MAG: rane protein involved in the export of O-antigen and teichoic acid [Patescibacteria group bacterium]|nr:rane protein involved in the export of O-antigen and teichoic acid [Patescibacteria group bacterium]
MSNMGRGVMYLGVSSIFFMLSGYLINILLGRHLGPELYGAYGVLMSLMTTMNIMQVSGMPQAVSKFTAEDEDNSEAILRSGIMIQLWSTLVIGLTFFVSAPLFAVIFKDPAFTGYMRALSLVFPFYGLFALYGGYYNGRHNFKRQAIINSTYSVVKLGLVVGLALASGLYGAIAGFVMASLFALIGAFHRPKTVRRFPYRPLILYSLPLIGFAVLSTLQLSVDLFSLKAMTSDARLVGYYAAAQSIAIIPFMAMSAIGQVLFPSIARQLGQGRVHDARRSIRQALRYLLLLLVPIAVLIAATAPDLISFLFGAKYLPAVPALRLLVLGYVFLTIFMTFANILNGSGRAHASALWAGIGVGTAFVLCILLIPNYGSIGAAATTCIGAFLAAAGAIIATYRSLKFRPPYLSIFRLSIAAMVLYAAAYFVRLPTAVLPLWYVALSAAYVWLLRLMGEITIQDWQMTKALFSKQDRGSGL